MSRLIQPVKISQKGRDVTDEETLDLRVPKITAKSKV